MVALVMVLYVLGLSWWLSLGQRPVLVETGLDGKSMLKQALTDRAWKLGYGRRTIFEVALDRWGDLGNLISGQREYAILDAERRARIRLRVVRRAVLLTVLVLAFPVLVISASVVIAVRAMDPVAAVAWLVGLPLLLWVVVVSVPTDPAEVRSARATMRRGLGGDAVLRAEAEAWREELAKATGGVGPGPGAPTTSRTYWAFQAAQMVALIPAAYMTAILISLGIFGQPSLPPLNEPQQFARVVGTGHLALGADGRTTSGEATELAASFAGPDPLLVPAPVQAAGGFAGVVARAIQGLGSDEAIALRGLVDGSTQDALARLARADGLAPSPLGPDGVVYGDHPIRRFPGLQSAAQRHIAAAALLVDEGDTEGAEIALRETYSVGRLLVQESNDVGEAIVGLRVATMALTALEQFYFGTQRFQEMKALEVPSGEAGTLGWAEWLERARRIVTDTAQVRSVRLATMHHLTVAAECGDLSGLLLGLPRSVEAEIERAAAALERVSADRPYIGMVTSGPERIRRAVAEGTLAEGRAPDAWVYLPLRWVGRLSGNPRLTSCPALAVR